MVLANGDVELPQFPRGPRTAQENERGNFTGNDVWAKGAISPIAPQGWYQLAPSWPGTVRAYGWANGPR